MLLRETYDFDIVLTQVRQLYTPDIVLSGAYFGVFHFIARI